MKGGYLSEQVFRTWAQVQTPQVLLRGQESALSAWDSVWVLQQAWAQLDPGGGEIVPVCEREEVWEKNRL